MWSLLMSCGSPPHGPGHSLTDNRAHQQLPEETADINRIELQPSPAVEKAMQEYFIKARILDLMII